MDLTQCSSCGVYFPATKEHKCPGRGNILGMEVKIDPTMKPGEWKLAHTTPSPSIQRILEVFEEKWDKEEDTFWRHEILAFLEQSLSTVEMDTARQIGLNASLAGLSVKDLVEETDWEYAVKRIKKEAQKECLEEVRKWALENTFGDANHPCNQLTKKLIAYTFRLSSPEGEKKGPT